MFKDGLILPSYLQVPGIAFTLSEGLPLTLCETDPSTWTKAPHTHTQPRSIWHFDHTLFFPYKLGNPPKVVVFLLVSGVPMISLKNNLPTEARAQTELRTTCHWLALLQAEIA